MPINIVLPMVTGGVIATAWLIPSTFGCALLGWLGAFGLSYLGTKGYRSLYLVGLISHSVAFYWLHNTIAKFGGFNFWIAGAIYLLFVAISSLQFVIYGFLVRHAPGQTRWRLLDIPLAWMGAETVAIRIFPWLLGHTQIAFTPLAQVADLGGARVISFVMLWVATSILDLAVRDDSISPRSSKRSPQRFGTQHAIPCVVSVACLSYGLWRVQDISDLQPRTQRVVIAQANISVEEKHNVAMIQINEQRYRELSAPLAAPDTLLIWPESVAQSWIPTYARHIHSGLGVPTFGDNQPALLIGALTMDAGQRIFNSAFAAQPSGEILPPYHKRILMPFGEYMPFSTIFPVLKKLMPGVAEFSPGDGPRVFTYAFDEGSGVEKLARVSPLICYEDVVPELARDSTQNGAELLVNITNDGWFGDTVAPYQHHMIATFRAIENRRTLIRSTNTGLTAIVSPLGQTIKTLPPFSEGVLIQQVPLLDEISPYTAVVGETPWKVLSYGLVILALVGLTKGRKYSRRAD